MGYRGGRRGAQRIVFSNDGLIYYTPDHYENFYLLYERRRQ
ncbi:ribonuclease domain-containing protein [uncultured Campylobacter sp.]|nr:ribonuclease domain-containing protein [uncultured Campylobacter sp.]